jgi:hypothetical protein
VVDRLPAYRTDWPNSRVTIARLFRGVARDDVKKMLHTNCKSLYRLDEVPENTDEPS